MEYLPNAGITIVLLILSELVKRSVFRNNADLKALIPYFCAVIGAIIAAVCFVFDPSMIGGVNNMLDAVAVGAFSGLCATGAHQLYKQGSKLLIVSKSVSSEVQEEVKNMTTEEKKEYITDIATDMLSSVLKKTQNKIDSSSSSSST